MTDRDITAAQAHAAHLALNDRSADRLALLAEIDRLRGLVTALWQGGEAVLHRAELSEARLAYWKANAAGGHARKRALFCEEQGDDDGTVEAKRDAIRHAQSERRAFFALRALGVGP